ncbi:3-hydroxybutyrate oligomer hydrolase family protein [Luteimonas sp. JM171]|uniref:3-hydroxybutyrate oligomer hydrolase family protein n=1 Tax=Luteimonas sp. JM171 TaxID=1896164 RepID=UPI000ACF02D8|nr:3-hydroxybutyrate oligomer hydrolase family protein [Luteimonas sp. JM171]
MKAESAHVRSIRTPLRAVLPALAALLLASCASAGQAPASATVNFSGLRVSEHRGEDDLLTGGQGLAGLRAPAAPAFADPQAPTAGELRQRAMWSNWRGIADLRPGGMGEAYGSLEAVPGREFHALARVPGARHPHRVMLQLPDAFDAGKPCVVVTASSGSRGIYGSIAVAGAWGLPRGCAVAYTDKGAGSDYFDLDAGVGFDASGNAAAEPGDAVFAPDAVPGAGGVAIAHAHSQDNPEADWGRHVRQAAEFAMHQLNEALPGAGPFDFDNTRVIAVGVSNGGGAVLRAAELEGNWLDAVVAGEPNVFSGGEGSRSLYDYTTQAALLMPCALAGREGLPVSPLTPASTPLRAARCASLAQAGLVEGADLAAQSESAWRQLRDSGWTPEALEAGALSVDFDLWRSVAVTYASAYGRYRAGEHPCGFSFSAQNPDFSPRPATAAERAAWWSDAGGIPPGNGVGIIDPLLAAPDLGWEGLQCLRTLATGDGEDARRVQAGVAATRAALPREGLPVVLVHGVDDGLIPIAFTSDPYAAWARDAGRDVALWRVNDAQHFDGFLILPDYGSRYVPLIPYVHAALDQVADYLDGAARMPTDADISPLARAGGRAPGLEQLAIP